MGAAGSGDRRRADLLLVERGLFPSRARAQAEIKAGTVRVDGAVLTRPSALIPFDAAIDCAELANPYVSRGGLKLAHGLDHFAYDPEGKIALDLGASTGGFTEVMLKHGAAKVYAVDVGHGQLHERLRGDPRVVSLEGVNARALDGTLIPDRPDLIVSDVSFISLKLALPPALALGADGARLIALIKPQFEAGRSALNKAGVVKDPSVHQAVCDAMVRWVTDDQGWSVDGVILSPIEGPDGNKEFLLGARKT